MSRRLAREVLELARSLEVPWSASTEDDLVQYCADKVRGWMESAVSVRSISDVERVVCEQLNLTFEEVWTDADLQRITLKYLGVGETVFASLDYRLNPMTIAALIQLKPAPGRRGREFVAVIDCRGSKGSRRFFTKWHEIAHLLTLPGNLEGACHRSSADADPVERLMDAIAAEIAFYDPIFAPALERQIAQEGGLTLAGVERLRSAYCIEASYHSTLIASAKRAQWPVIYLEAGMGYKRSERTAIDAGQLAMFDGDGPQARLRALAVRPNPYVRGTGMRIDLNMEIPASSAIAYAFQAEGQSAGRSGIARNESLGEWVHSDGSALPAVTVTVEAVRRGDRVLALVSPLRSDKR